MQNYFGDYFSGYFSTALPEYYSLEANPEAGVETIVKNYEGYGLPSINSPEQDLRVLELGIGAGAVSIVLARKYPKLITLASAPSCRVQDLLFQRLRPLIADLTLVKAHELNKPLNSTYDLIVFHPTFSPPVCLRSLLRTLRSFLKPGGQVLVPGLQVLQQAHWTALAKEILEDSLTRLEQGRVADFEATISLAALRPSGANNACFVTEEFIQHSLRTLGFNPTLTPSKAKSSLISHVHPEGRLCHLLATLSSEVTIPEGWISDSDQRIFEAVLPYTMTVPERVLCLIQAIQYVEKMKIPGSFVECGVWKGGSSMTAALALLREGSSSRELFLFDTYEGMSPPTEHDVTNDGLAAAAILAEQPKDKSNHFWAYSPLEDVKCNLQSTGYPMNRIHFIKGKVEDTIPATLPGEIALLRLDTDWYESTIHELRHLYPLLRSGGILIIDDYGYWKGSKQAVDEYFATLREAPKLHEIDEVARYCVKP